MLTEFALNSYWIVRENKIVCMEKSNYLVECAVASWEKILVEWT